MKRIISLIICIVLALGSMTVASGKTLTERLTDVENELGITSQEGDKAGDRLSVIEDNLGITAEDSASVDERLKEAERQVGILDIDESSVNETKKGYGTLTGNITYYYNDYKGNVSDTDSAVLLIPNDSKNLDIPAETLMYFNIWAEYNTFEEGVYCGIVNGIGSYTINHIPEGDYFVLIVSGQTKDEGWFRATKDGKTNDSFYDSIANEFDGRLNSADARKIAEAIAYKKYKFTTISIYAGETTVLDYDFGITYI